MLTSTIIEIVFKLMGKITSPVTPYVLNFKTNGKFDPSTQKYCSETKKLYKLIPLFVKLKF